ncbi:MAG: aldehyde ferredoxin oxidoreductase family protein [Anaerolineae bacterium]|nr:aldehyde ferredoxin oxidoreductase family protein [Anaerolineae bacterium]
MYGWRGTILRVDLTREKITKQPLDESVARNFIGGRGFNSKTLFEEVKPGIDPLSPENVLCLAPGPLSGTPLGLTSRLEVSTLSPYSGILGDGNVGGSFATFLKRAGYDQIVITGRASSPKYLWIDDENVELRDASDLWSKTTWETTDILRERHGKKISVGCIGQAGENLVRFASTIVDKHSSAARGSGAVWGSKNLKAIAVRGSGKVELASPEEFRHLAREDRKFFLKDHLQHEVIAVYGTHIGMMSWWPGYRYFQKYLSGDEVPEPLRPEAWKKYEIGRYACYGCPVGCKDVFRIPTGKRAGEAGSGLEFECIACLGTNCGVEDPIAIMEMENLADAYGMDVIALGNTIALAKELYSRGIIAEEDTGGLSLDWEDADSQIELVHQTALREGFGNLIAEGMYSLAKIIGQGAMDVCYHVKGLSRGPHPPGFFALAHAVSTRGADHLRGRSWAYGENDPEAFPELVKKGLVPDVDKDPVGALTISERATTITDAMGRCKGAVNSWVCAVPLVWKHPLWDGLARLLRAATGFEFDATSLEEAGERIYALERAFNVRQGITREDDRLPQKPEVRETPQGEEELMKHAGMLIEYYRVHGYDPETGIPTRERLERLGLKYVADELKAHGPYPQWDGPSPWPLDKYPHGGKRA